MAKRREHPAALAAASDGSLLLNRVSELPEALRRRLMAELGTAVFVGVALDPHAAKRAMARLDDAAAEVSARLLARRRPHGVEAKKAETPEAPARRPTRARRSE